ncbi:MAG TPA: MbnH family di-heme enzyme [Candidatus Polarisedimenticolia bacterium]|nr:MbnH family di-heme enzyme [Candidatus Polarisedimenticolia bacterium]
MVAGSFLLVALFLALGGATAARAAEPAERPSAPPAAYAWRLPPGFPVPLVPADNPQTQAKVDLGRLLFYEKSLSGNGSYSCASCHRQDLAFTDGRARALGSTGETHPRSAMSLANVAYSATLTWADARLRRLEDQALIPMVNDHPVEMGLAGREAEVLARLRASPGYPARFAAAFPQSSGPVTMANAARALAAFERTLLSGDSPYDRFVYRGDGAALSEPAKRGMKLFFSDRLHCSVCHGGFTFSGPVAFAGLRPIDPVFHNTGLYNLGGAGAYPEDDPGLWKITGKREDMGRFRAPTLRNIELTAPYMHDGSIATLEGVVDHYARGGRTITEGPYGGAGRDSPWKSELVAGFELDAPGRQDLVEFLRSLTDRSFLTDPSFSDPHAPPPDP